MSAYSHVKGGMNERRGIEGGSWRRQGRLEGERREEERTGRRRVNSRGKAEWATGER